MPAITYSDFSGGIDRRLSINVQDASRLWTLKNAYITSGKKIKKRPGLKLVSGAFNNPYTGWVTVGLTSVNGQLTTFGAATIPPGLPAGVVGVPLSAPILSGTAADLVDVPYCVAFQGYLYVVAKWYHVTVGTFYKHHYLDGVTGIVTDSNCPHGPSVTVAASRIFSDAADVVRYSAAGDASDWTTASDAGFLPASLQQNTNSPVTAVGVFQDALVTFFEESAQIWDVAVDPSANKIRKRIFGLGTTAPYSLASFSNDLVFLSPFGFRSMYVSSQTDRIDDLDVGSPIDSLVVPDIAVADPASDPSKVIGAWLPQLGQYWAIFNMGTYSKAWVYSYSKASKLAAWSEYVFPTGLVIEAIATKSGKVYVRADGLMFELADDQYTDANSDIEVEVQMAFQDAKSPGVLKQFSAADFVFDGSWDVSYKYDPRDQAKETVPQSIEGDTRPGDLISVEVCAPAIAPVFRHTANEAAQIDAVTMYYETLGLMG